MIVPREVAASGEWLARTKESPEVVQQDWHQQGLALLPCGIRFCAIRLPAPLVHAAVATTDQDEVARALAELLAGPVIRDTTGTQYYALTEVIPPQLWPSAEAAPLLGRGSYLGVPAPRCSDPPGSYWVALPDLPGDLCPLAAVSALVHRGMERLREEAS